MYHSFIVVLPELPFPGPSSSKRTDNLLHSPNVADEAREILHRPDRALVQQLSQALCIAKSTTDQLYVKKNDRSSLFVCKWVVKTSKYKRS